MIEYTTLPPPTNHVEQLLLAVLLIIVIAIWIIRETRARQKKPEYIKVTLWKNTQKN